MKEKKCVATAVAVEVKPQEEVMADKPPELEPVGQCPQCNHDLAKREVRQPFDMRMQLSHHTERKVILEFWACQNPHCSLMFWRLPAAINPRGVDTDYDRH